MENENEVQAARNESVNVPTDVIFDIIRKLSAPIASKAVNLDIINKLSSLVSVANANPYEELAKVLTQLGFDKPPIDMTANSNAIDAEDEFVVYRIVD